MMNEGFQVLNDLFNNEIISKPINDSGNSFVYLEEKDPAAKLKKIRLCGIHGNLIVIKLDKYKGERKLLNDENGVLMRCDYILFLEIKSKCHICFIELKSTKFYDKDIIQKFKSSLCIIDYCNAILKRFYYDKNPPDISSFINHFILFYKADVDAQQTRPYKNIHKQKRKQECGQLKKENTPDNYKK